MYDPDNAGRLTMTHVTSNGVSKTENTFKYLRGNRKQKSLKDKILSIAPLLAELKNPAISAGMIISYKPSIRLVMICSTTQITSTATTRLMSLRRAISVVRS